MKPKFKKLYPPRLFYTASDEPVAVIGASIRVEPDEGLVLWARRPHNAGIHPYRISTDGKLNPFSVWGWEYRPAYEIGVELLKRDSDLHFAAGALLQKVAPGKVYPFCTCCSAL